LWLIEFSIFVMPTLLLDDGTIKSDFPEIVAELAPLNIELKHFATVELLILSNLLEPEVLTQLEKQQIVELHQDLFAYLQAQQGYLWCDVMNLHPGSPHIENVIATYSRYHNHTAAEALYVLAGEMIFGFVTPDGHQIQLLMQPQDYIHIPAGVEHWCSPTALLNFTGLRFFTTIEGWVPNYTGTQLIDSRHQQQ
jgi:1,2-dihydroxy-3-keto-5-methylthiopentene dioxygenase